MKVSEGKIMEQLKLQKSWFQIRHILADYVLSPVLILLFDKIAQSPQVVGHKYYLKILRQIKDAATPQQQGYAKFRKNDLEKQWNTCFPKLLIEFYYLRLLGTQVDKVSYQTRANKYCIFFLNMIGDGNVLNNPVKIAGDYLSMLQDYLLRNCPGLPPQAIEWPVGELLRKVRTLYLANASVQGYLPFEENIYPAGILQLIDEVAESWESNLICRFFLITPEYLYGLFVYVYMVEFIIFANNCDAPKMAPDMKKYKTPNLITHLQNYIFSAKGKS